MDLLRQGGLNYPIAATIIFALLILCGVAFSLIRAERIKSISANEIRTMDRVINSLLAGMVILFAMFCMVLSF